MNTTNEADYVSIGKAAALFPQSASGNHPSPATIWRWYQRGIAGIKLQTWKIGGGRFTTRKAVTEFIAATTAAADTSPPSETLTPRPADVERRLQAAGVI